MTTGQLNKMGYCIKMVQNIYQTPCNAVFIRQTQRRTRWPWVDTVGLGGKQGKREK